MPARGVHDARPEGSPAVERIDRAIGELPGARAVSLDLEPLDEPSQLRLAAQLLDDDGPDAVRSMVLERCDGNPLFIEQLVATLLDRGALRHGADGWSVDPVEADTVPPSLQGLLLGRLDALPRPVRRLALIGSVIGREFPVGLVRAVAVEAGEADAVDALEDIDAGGLLQRSGPDGGLLGFRHALIHDAAYSSLVRGDRRRLHGIVGRCLERDATRAGRIDQAAAALAYHFSRAKDHPKALRYGRDAARRAAVAYANSEAIDLYGTAIQSARALLAGEREPDGAAARQAELVDVLEARARLVRQAGRYEEAEGIFREAFALVPAEPRVGHARWLQSLATCASDRKAWDEEEALLLEAEQVLGQPDAVDDRAWWGTWIDGRMARAELEYWIGRIDDLSG